MKLHTALMSGAFVTAVAAERSAANKRRLRHLKADSKSSKNAGKAGKGSSSYSSSYSMSYGPPPPTTPPTPNPTPVPEPPTTPPSPAPTPTCCNPGFLEELISTNVYNNEPDFNEDAMDWLKEDNCDCGEFCSDNELIQRYILATLYYSTDGDNWTNCSQTEIVEPCEVQSQYGNKEGFNWLTCSSECDWAGTGCRDDNITLNATDVEHNNLVGNLPSEMAVLPRLAVLALEQNELTGTIPSSYGDLTKLVLLDLDFNSLTGTLFDMSQMPRLQQLDLNQNSLTGPTYNLGWENTNLKFIDLSYNKFTGTIAQEIGNLTELRSLQFQCNDFEAPLVFNNCPKDDLIADEDICSNSTPCDCTNTNETYPTDCTAALASKKRVGN